METVQEREEIRRQWGSGLIDVDVEVTGEKEAGGERGCNGEEF